MDSTPPARNPLSPDSLEFRSIDVTYVAELQGLPLNVWFKFGKLLRLPSNGGFFSSIVHTYEPSRRAHSTENAQIFALLKFLGRKAMRNILHISSVSRYIL